MTHAVHLVFNMATQLDLLETTLVRLIDAHYRTTLTEREIETHKYCYMSLTRSVSGAPALIKNPIVIGVTDFSIAEYLFFYDKDKNWRWYVTAHDTSAFFRVHITDEGDSILFPRDWKMGLHDMHVSVPYTFIKTLGFAGTEDTISDMLCSYLGLNYRQHTAHHFASVFTNIYINTDTDIGRETP